MRRVLRFDASRKAGRVARLVRCAAPSGCSYLTWRGLRNHIAGPEAARGGWSCAGSRPLGDAAGESTRYCRVGARPSPAYPSALCGLDLTLRSVGASAKHRLAPYEASWWILGRAGRKKARAVPIGGGLRLAPWRDHTRSPNPIQCGPRSDGGNKECNLEWPVP